MQFTDSEPSERNPVESSERNTARKSRVVMYSIPRFAMQDLKRMSIRDLRDLSSRLGVDLSRLVKKQDLIRKLVESGRIDIIGVEYPLSLLRGMGIGELKRCMADAGVFFNPVHVVEKEDMVNIFVNSGRLILLPEEHPDDAVAESASDDTSSRKRLALDRIDTSPEITASTPPVVTTAYESEDDKVQGNVTAHGVDQASWMKPVSDLSSSQISHCAPDEHTAEDSSYVNVDNPQMETRITLDESPDTVAHGVEPLQETASDADETPFLLFMKMISR